MVCVYACVNVYMSVHSESDRGFDSLEDVDKKYLVLLWRGKRVLNNVE